MDMVAQRTRPEKSQNEILVAVAVVEMGRINYEN